MSTWTKQKLGDIADVKGGKRLPQGYFVGDEKTLFPYIRVTDMVSGRVALDVMKYISAEAQRQVSRYTISDRDIYISIAGTIGLVGKIPAQLDGANLTENAAKITAIQKNSDRDFILYYLGSRVGQFQIKQRIGGSTQPKLALNRIETIEIPTPDLSTQTRIASVLSAYDDLIENNDRRIKILEEMAQRLYREWFVKFNFPRSTRSGQADHEKVRLIDSGTEYGKIPEGWEVKRLDSEIELAYGKALKEDDRILGNVSVCGSGGIVGTHNEKLASGPGIVVGRKGNAGAVSWVDSNFWVIDTAYFVKTKLNLVFTYYLLKTQNFVLGDAAVPGLNREQAYRNSILVPPIDLIYRYAHKAEPLRELIGKIKIKNSNLSKTRDLLIPQLVTGRREVK